MPYQGDAQHKINFHGWLNTKSTQNKIGSTQNWLQSSITNPIKHTTQQVFLLSQFLSVIY